MIPTCAASRYRPSRRWANRVVEAEHGADAMSRLDAIEDLRLVFTDVSMPGPLNGVQLAEEIRRRRPDVQVLLTSGYIKSDRALGGLSVLLKPYTTNELRASAPRAAGRYAGGAFDGGGGISGVALQSHEIIASRVPESRDAKPIAQLLCTLLWHAQRQEPGLAVPPRSIGSSDAGQVFTPEIFSSRKMFAKRSLTNLYRGSGQTMKRSLPSHDAGSISRLGSAIM